MPLLYDRDCGFCRVSVALVLAWDRRHRLRPVAIQSQEGKRLLAGMPQSERLAAAHAVLPDGGVRSGGTAAAPVLRRLPGGAPLARLCERQPTLTSRGYEFVARRRGTLGRAIPQRAVRWAERVIGSRSGREALLS